MKLNPNKYTFGVASEKFLGFMVSQRGIEANQEKVRAILDMASPKTVKAKVTDKCLPFFKTLKQAFS